MGTVRVFRQKFTPEDPIGSDACSLEANRRVTNDIHLGSSLLLPVTTVNCVQTLKVHMDLAARNILVGPGLLCKVADFGLTRRVDKKNKNQYVQTEKMKVPMKWMSPESMVRYSSRSSSQASLAMK
jgi:serine/threonine protein kinase